MSYVDEVWKRAEQRAADEWDDMGLIAQTWAKNAILYEGSDKAYQLALCLYVTAVSGNSTAADLDQMRDLFIFERSDLFYPDAEAEIREEQQEAADARREDEWAERMQELRNVEIRG